MLGVKLNYASDDRLRFGAAHTSLGQGTGNPEHTVTALTASYRMGNLSLGGGYQTESDMGGTAGSDRDSYTLDLSYQATSNGVFKVQYVASDADAANSDASQIAAGYDHALDKATMLYLAYASTDNDPSSADWHRGSSGQARPCRCRSRWLDLDNSPLMRRRQAGQNARAVSGNLKAFLFINNRG